MRELAVVETGCRVTEDDPQIETSESVKRKNKRRSEEDNGEDPHAQSKEKKKEISKIDNGGALTQSEVASVCESQQAGTMVKKNRKKKKKKKITSEIPPAECSKCIEKIDEETSDQQAEVSAIGVEEENGIVLEESRSKKKKMRKHIKVDSEIEEGPRKKRPRGTEDSGEAGNGVIKAGGDASNGKKRTKKTDRGVKRMGVVNGCNGEVEHINEDYFVAEEDDQRKSKKKKKLILLTNGIENTPI